MGKSHRNQLNLVKYRQLRSATKPAIGPIGDDSLNAGGDGRMCRVCGEFKEWEGFGSFEWTCLECRQEASDAAAHKAVQAPARTVFAVGDVLCPIPARLGSALVADAEYIVTENRDDYIVVTGPLRLGYESNRSFPPDRFQLVRRAGEVKQAVTLPAGWRYISAQTASDFALESYEAYEHATGAVVYLNGATWAVFAKGGDSSTRNEAMRLALEGPSA